MDVLIFFLLLVGHFQTLFYLTLWYKEVCETKRSQIGRRASIGGEQEESVDQPSRTRAAARRSRGRRDESEESSDDHELSLQREIEDYLRQQEDSNAESEVD